MSAAESDRSLRILVSGRVQGVAFRYFTRQAARRLGLVGWVRNLPTGEVEVRVSGPAATLERFRAELRQGPPASRVDDLVESELEGAADWTDFDIVY